MRRYKLVSHGCMKRGRHVSKQQKGEGAIKEIKPNAFRNPTINFSLADGIEKCGYETFHGVTICMLVSSPVSRGLGSGSLHRKPWRQEIVEPPK